MIEEYRNIEFEGTDENASLEEAGEEIIEHVGGLVTDKQIENTLVLQSTTAIDTDKSSELERDIKLAIESHNIPVNFIRAYVPKEKTYLGHKII